MSYSRVKVIVPDINVTFQDYGSPHIINANIRLLQNINSKYGATVEYWGNIFEIAKGVLVAFMATESGGNFFGVNRFQACGLMQVTPNAVWECVRKWKQVVGSELPREATTLLNQKIPFIFTSKNIQPDGTFQCLGLSNNACTRYAEGTTGQRKIMIDALTKDNNFNIMCGTLVLRWMLQRFSSPVSGLTFGQLNKAIVGYNAGAYLRVLGGTSTTAAKIPIDTTRLASIVSSEPRNYLYKMLGKNGFLDLIYRRKAI